MVDLKALFYAERVEDPKSDAFVLFHSGNGFDASSDKVLALLSQAFVQRTLIFVAASDAAKYGAIDPDDIEAVQRWYTEQLPTLPIDTIEQVLQDLLTEDGATAEHEISPVYPERAPLPSLSSVGASSTFAVSAHARYRCARSYIKP